MLLPVANKLVIIEGNISSGKSTLVRELESLLQYRVFLEPTLSNPYLEKFYKGSLSTLRSRLCGDVVLVLSPLRLRRGGRRRLAFWRQHLVFSRLCRARDGEPFPDPKAYALKMQLWLLRNRFRTFVAALRHIETTGACGARLVAPSRDEKARAFEF